MLADADLKNQAETLCFEAEKELSLVKDTLAPEKQETITKLVQEIRQSIQNNQLDTLSESLENLKLAMQDIIVAKGDPTSKPMVEYIH